MTTTIASPSAMTTPLVSVTMLSFNRPQFVRQAIESVLGQTFRDFEFIILDNSADLEAFIIAQEYAAKDSRIRLYREEQKMGPHTALDKVVAYAAGKYLANIEDDDYWSLDKLEKQVAFMEEHADCALYSCSRVLINEKNESLGKSLLRDSIALPLSSADVSELININYNGSGNIFNRDVFMALGGWRRFFQTAANDIDLFFRIQEKYVHAATSDCLLYYRVWGNNISSGSKTCLYAASAAVSAAHRRKGLPDPVADSIDVEDFIVAHYFSVHCLPDKHRKKSTRKIAKYFLRRRKYAELSKFLARCRQASDADFKLYLNLVAWSVWYGRMGYWIHR